MEVHMGKMHTETFECGLCELEAGSLASLEVYLNTCEIFQCDQNNSCNKRFRMIIDIKNQINKEHKEEYGYMQHLKIDRNDCNEVTEKPYRSDRI